MRNLEVRFKGAPTTPGEVEVVAAEVPPLTNGGILCHAHWLAADALFAPLADHPAVFGGVVPALGVYEVIESRNDVFTVGQRVVIDCGMRELCATDGHNAVALYPGQSPSSTALGVLGPPGMAAYFGLIDLGGLHGGQTVLVAAASSTAGAMAGQIAALKGARAIGLDDSAEKCSWATRHARFAACINVSAEDLSKRLWQLAPQGCDLFFDAGKGQLLDALLGGQHLAPGARVVLGPHSPHHAQPAPGSSEARARVRILRLDPHDYERRRAEFLKEAITWYGSGRLVCREDVIVGLENAPAHLDKVLRGEHFGQPLIKV